MNDELIKKARRADLASYLSSVGVPLIKCGNRYRHKEHSSLTFTENAYYWNSRGEHGNAIDYVTKYMNMGFIEAVNALAQTNAHQEPIYHEFSFNDISLKNDMSRVTAYLIKTRHIGYSIIEYLLKNKLLFQEKNTNNAVYPIYDENNNIVGAETHGTLSDMRYKGIKKGSKYGYGFNVRFSNDNQFNYALFFESAIDLISFIDYKFNYEKKSLDKCILVSMAGLKENTLLHTLEVFKGDLKVVLCVDNNDEASKAFKKTLEQKKIAFKVCSPDEQFKDWNEQITAFKNTKKTVNRLLERNSIK